MNRGLKLSILVTLFYAGNLPQTADGNTGTSTVRKRTETEVDSASFAPIR